MLICISIYSQSTKSIIALTDTFSSNLPIIIINTNGQDIPDEPKIEADLGIIYNGEGVRNFSCDSLNNYNGKIGIELHGTSSLQYPKKSFGFETRKNDGSDYNVSLIGLPKESDWILYAPYSDKSLVRNVITYKWAADAGRYAPRCRFCELILNGNYWGVYVLMEKIKRDKNRVNIAKLEDDDISGIGLTGGYIVKIDWPDPNDLGWVSIVSNAQFFYHHPKGEDLLQVQRNYIRDYITQFEYVLIGNNFKDPVNGYYKFINMDSFIDFMIGQEMAKNRDAFRASTFMFKDRDSIDNRLNMGPLWDFNIAYGNHNKDNFEYAGGWSFEWLANPIIFWWSRLLQDSIFTTKLIHRWTQLESAE